jgi:hypothetical protein
MFIGLYLKFGFKKLKPYIIQFNILYFFWARYKWIQSKY